MNRSLLLLPFLALVLMACPQKHTTAAAGGTPPAPNADGYNNPGSNGNAGSNSNSNTGSNSSTGSNSNTGSNGNSTTVGSVDSIVIVGAKPDSIRTRLVVSFYSPGDGIDLAAQENLDKYLSKHKDVTYTTTRWGREGEITYCFLMTDKRSEEQAKVVSDIRGIVSTSTKVNVYENQVCDHTHTAAVVATETTEEMKADSGNIARVVVSFISKGEGIDTKAKDRFDAWLKENNTVYEVKNWGREGEINYCFFLTGMQTRQQDIFVRDLRTFIGENDLVLVEEWGKCDRRK